MRQYQLEFGFDSFISRCEAILMVCRGFNWFQYLIYDHNEIREESVIRLFAAMDAEKLAFLASKKGAEREIAVQVLAKWDREGYGPVLARALEKEKSKKVRTLFEAVLQ